MICQFDKVFPTKIFNIYNGGRTGKVTMLLPVFNNTGGCLFRSNALDGHKFGGKRLVDVDF